MEANNHTTIEWIFWGFLVISSIILLLTSIVFYSIIYKKENRKVITIEKIPILGMFLALFVIQAYFTRIFPHTNEIIPFSMDDLTIIAIGFLFGPIEAIFFGAIADITRTLINGWGFQIVSFFIFPITGLIAGIYGNMYRKNKNKFKQKGADDFFKIEIIYLIFIALTFLWLINYVEDFRYEVAYSYLGISLVFVGLLSVWLYYLNKKKRYQDLNLILFISITIILARVYTGYIIRPFAQHFYFNYNWRGEINLRILTSSYLIYIRIFAYFYFIKAVFYASSIVK